MLTFESPREWIPLFMMRPGLRKHEPCYPTRVECWEGLHLPAIAVYTVLGPAILKDFNRDTVLISVTESGSG